MSYRPATEADLAGEYAVFAAAQEELHVRRGAPWASRPFDPTGMWARVHRHMLTHNGKRSFVALHDAYAGQASTR